MMGNITAAWHPGYKSLFKAATQTSQMKTPCKRDCQTRCPGCHAECEAYKAWRAAYDAEKDKIAKRRREMNAAQNFLAENCNKVIRDLNKKK